ncbi:MAG: DUF3124 domain-containing protein [Flavobacteriales bacterium]|nr:DUF3124 domain-containing protein [Flavobacteriales bacterium]MCB9363501.1 DUF3124 domain-containing protein [Flavobacteriales bacterium]
MKNIFLLIIGVIVFYSCDNKQKEMSSINPVNWNKRAVELNSNDSLIYGETYLSIYSQIYSYTEHLTHDLTSTISMRNTSLTDTIYMIRANYYDTHGKLIRTYFKNPIYIAPMETVSIVIDETDKEGGTGANFIFDWAIKPHTTEPIFEGIQLSTAGRISFTTNGIRTK